jgi:hypothetical protein
MASVAGSHVGSMSRRKSKRARNGGTEVQISSTLDSMEGEALDELIELLESDPRKIFPTLRWAKSSVLAKRQDEKDPEAEEPFNNTYRKLYRIPKDFLREFLPTLTSQPMMITCDLLARIERAEDGAIRDLIGAKEFVVSGCHRLQHGAHLW